MTPPPPPMLTYVAGGRAYGAVTLKAVSGRLRGGQLPVLRRVRADFTALPLGAQALLSPLVTQVPLGFSGHLARFAARGCGA